MSTITLPRQPEMEMVGPNWFHHHGIKVRLDQSYDGDVPGLRLVASAASLTILLNDNSSNFPWSVSWEVVQSQTERTTGTVRMSDQQLRAAFGLEEMIPDWSAWMIHRFGGEAAVQGKFIRWENYLNIPGPGTGHDGDPNISIDLDEEMQQAVRVLIG